MPRAVIADTCDANGDNVVDRLDLGLISRARNQSADSPDDPRDADGDGAITTFDVRRCLRLCTLPNCAVPVNRAPVILSLPPLLGRVGANYAYDVEAEDADGDPLTFSLDTAPAGMSIDPASGLIAWTPAAAQGGDNPVAVRVEDGRGGFATQAFVVHVETPVEDYERPAVTLALNPEVTGIGNAINLNVTVTDNVGVESIELLIDGVPTPLDAGGNASFSSASAGIFPVEARALDTAGNEGAASGEMRFLRGGDTTPPTVALTAPAPHAVLAQITDVIGTAVDDEELLRYTLELSPAGRNQFRRVAEGNLAVTNGVLGQFDTTLLRNGHFDLRLTAEDASGNTASTTRTVLVEGDDKSGAFSLSFTDISIPLAGIPIEVTRSYDSFDREIGDFGFGWRFLERHVQLSESGVLGNGWEQTVSGGFFPTYFLEPTEIHRAAVTFPTGRTETFDMVLNPSSSLLFPFGVTLGTNAAFVASASSVGDLQSLANNNLFVLGGSVGPVQLVDDLPGLGDVYDPDRYHFTDADGTQLRLNQNTAGLESIADTNGNVITFGPGGVIHSLGVSVAFARDGAARITRATDPNGNQFDYRYDFYGDLVAVTDPLGNVTRYIYDAAHRLVDVIDPSGIRTIHNEYDADGRLAATTDADGNRTEF